METKLATISFTRTGVLNNQDLMGQVFKHLDDDLKLESTRKKQLLSAGLTCRSFLDPALDILWRSMHSIMPLLRILPSFQKVNGSSSYVSFFVVSTRTQSKPFYRSSAESKRNTGSVTITIHAEFERWCSTPRGMMSSI